MTTTKQHDEKTPYLRVHLTEEDMTCAIEASGSLCVAAQAINRCYPEMLRVKVDLQTIRMTDRQTNRRYVYLTPRRVAEMLLAFDHGIKPEPFAFTLQRGQVLSYSRPTITVEKGSPIRTGGKAPPRIKGIPYKRAFGLCNLSAHIQQLEEKRRA